MGLDMMERDDLQINPEDLRARAQAAMGEAELSQARAAALIGLSSAALNQWLKGVYKGDNEAVEGKMRRWLESPWATERGPPAVPGHAPGR